MGLRSFLLKRVIYTVILIFFVATLNFVIFETMPGDPRAMFIAPGHALNPEEQQQLLEYWGLAGPFHERYLTYLYNMLTWRFGRSFASGNRWVILEILDRLPNTLLLMGCSTILSIVIGTILGVIAASRRGKAFDSVAVVSSLTTYSLPSFWMGMVLMLIFAIQLRWLPMGHTSPLIWATNPPDNALEYIAGRLHHLFLPTLTLVLFMYGGFLLLTRSTMLETLTEDYVLTAKAKGLKQRTVLFKHALKNASLPLITNAAISFGFMLSGAIITEQVFSWRGLGQWIWRSIQIPDYPALQAIFYIISLCVIIANLIADILYGVIDPRIKYE